MPDLNRIARRIADGVLMHVRRISRYVTIMLVAAVVIAAVSSWLGVAALDGGAQTVWVVLAIVFGWFSISRVVRLRWNLARLARNRPALEDEVLLVLDQRSDTERVVVDLSDADVSDDTTMELWSRQFVTTSIDPNRMAGYRWLPLAGRALKQLGVALITTTFITAVFAVMGLLFLVALALS